MILHLNEQERNTVVKALAMLAEEYRTLGESMVSEYLRRGFRDDATVISNLAGRAAGLEESPTVEVLIAEIRRLMSMGHKIEAIKYVRAHRAMGLKEAKDYVEQVGI
jgi:hypothetical protein